jgi:hypothetical protein
MAEFQNTIDVIGDDVAAKRIVYGTIEEYNDDVIAIIGSNAFSNCYNLTSVNIPNVTSVEANAFQSCTKLTSVDMSNVTSVGNRAFYSCIKLTSVDMPNVTSVGNQAFQNCTILKTVILRNDAQVCTLSNTIAFSGTPFASGKAGGTLLVPSALVESYKTATNWSVIWGYGHNQFLALEDYTVDGTITGAIDWDKLNGGTT